MAVANNVERPPAALEPAFLLPCPTAKYSLTSSGPQGGIGSTLRSKVTKTWVIHADLYSRLAGTCSVCHARCCATQTLAS